MKVTEKTTKHEVETAEIVCEIAKAEFEQVCAETAAKTVVKFIGDNPELDDIMAGMQLTSLFAEFAASLTKKLFTINDKTEKPNKKEEK